MSEINKEKIINSNYDVEKQAEPRIKPKYPGNSGQSKSGHSAFLQKLAKEQKYFDSGDYQMARQKMIDVERPAYVPPHSVTGNAIPKPDTVPARKTTNIYSSKFYSNPC